MDKQFAIEVAMVVALAPFGRGTTDYICSRNVFRCYRADMWAINKACTLGLIVEVDEDVDEIEYMLNPDVSFESIKKMLGETLMENDYYTNRTAFYTREEAIKELVRHGHIDRKDEEAMIAGVANVPNCCPFRVAQDYKKG